MLIPLSRMYTLMLIRAVNTIIEYGQDFESHFFDKSTRWNMVAPVLYDCKTKLQSFILLSDIIVVILPVSNVQLLARGILQSAWPLFIKFGSRANVWLGNRASSIERALCNWLSKILVPVNSALYKLALEKLTLVKSASMNKAYLTFECQKLEYDKLA